MKFSDKKIQLGEHYTPRSLAQFVVWSAFQQFFHHKLPKEKWQKNFELKILKNSLTDLNRFQMLEQIKDIKILDLGVGDGAFLLAAGKFLETIHLTTDTQDLISLKLKLLQRNLYGVDYSSQAVHSCRKELKTWIMGENKSDQSLKITKKVEKALEQKIRIGNVLLGGVFPNDGENLSVLVQDEESVTKKKRVFNWYEEFPILFNSEKSGFDLILCNPPYVTKDISPGDIRLYRQLYQKQIFVNRFNLYHLFFARVNDLLAQNGISVFLTSNSVLTDYYSSNIRDFLFSNFSIKLILDFVSRTKIFPNVLQGTCILVILKKNEDSEQKTQIIRTFDMSSLIQGEIAEGCISTSRLFYFKKIIPSPYIKTLDILEFLRKNCVSLKNLFKIQSGEIRPADKKIRPHYFKEITEDYNSSDFEIVLNGKNIGPYLINLNENRQKPRWYRRPMIENERIFREDHAQSPRIVFQRITAREQLRRVVTGKIDKKHLKIHKRIWAENNINYFLLNDDLLSNWFVSAEALLGIFNSLLINWYIHQINLTAAIPPADLGLIPLPRKQSEKHEQWQQLHQKVLKIKKLLQGCSSSSEIFTHLCPVCTSTGELSQLQSEINNLVFLLYELPEIYKTEIMTQLSQHHQYFNHH
ncbi:MAG: Eco57I restriction-modification methylase domain-containing protein [Candidatus Hodarchaeales archaeon]|jgi:hypothetical protein